ncbi:BT_3987 domain-containing protein [Mucilaginibacter glaciei]|uniref:DUF1735 domain-containing protein n=1 Tax=Mucilaginibacter glaciei TaxID=2772109 RepID=A0A926NRS9_9SPHI|nr:DUF1735 domain-containing protein [Mucilaginibacter glaciei]MBD1393472.1 DUF1735 domain-containing protein [Mucilaginibacter glaciei]
MKRRFYIKTALVALIAAAGFSSCLKDDKNYVDFAGAKPLIELPSAANVGGSGGLLQAAALSLSAAPVPINLAVNLAAPKTLGTDVTVKLSVDQAALTAYNTANGTSYILLPAAAYSSTFSAVIKAGTNLSNLVININTGVIDPSITNYVLPISITDGGGQQISNYKTVLYNVQVKNQYDGSYRADGTITFPPPTAGRSEVNVTKALTTINANTVQTTVFDLGGNGFIMWLTVNADNTVTVKPSPGSANQTIQNNGPCTYSPTTKTFTLNYKYVGGTGDRVIFETFKLK